MPKIETPDQLLAVLARTTLDVPQKLDIIEFLWGERPAWNGAVYQNALYLNLDVVLRQSNQEFIDDMVRFGRPMRDYMKDLWYRLMRLRANGEELDPETDSEAA